MYAGRSGKYGGPLAGAQISPRGRRKLIKINQKFMLHANSINQRSRDPAKGNSGAVNELVTYICRSLAGNMEQNGAEEVGILQKTVVSYFMRILT